jgi:hypothetical protein
MRGTPAGPVISALSVWFLATMSGVAAEKHIRIEIMEPGWGMVADVGVKDIPVTIAVSGYKRLRATGSWGVIRGPFFSCLQVLADDNSVLQNMPFDRYVRNSFHIADHVVSPTSHVNPIGGSVSMPMGSSRGAAYFLLPTLIQN